MVELLAEIVQEIEAGFDSRVSHCKLEAARVVDGCLWIGGEVLTEGDRRRVLDSLSDRLPGIVVDDGGLAVLDHQPTRLLTVGTNLTGLYREPRWLSEQLSQLVNGTVVEVLRHEGRWAFVRQTDGYLGWLYSPYLHAEPAPAVTHIVSETSLMVHAAPTAYARVATRVFGGTDVAACEAGDWAHLSLTGDLEGWAEVKGLRPIGSLPRFESTRRQQIAADAERFIGVPYQWGGGTVLGVDCSGFAQLVHRLCGITLPRDADMQFDAGKPVEEPYKPGDLLFFGETGAARKITHVAISLGGWEVIHSSRSRNGVYHDDVRSVEHLRESFVGARTFVV